MDQLEYFCQKWTDVATLAADIRIPDMNFWDICHRYVIEPFWIPHLEAREMFFDAVQDHDREQCKELSIEVVEELVDRSEELAAVDAHRDTHWIMMAIGDMSDRTVCEKILPFLVELTIASKSYLPVPGPGKVAESEE